MSSKKIVNFEKENKNVEQVSSIHKFLNRIKEEEIHLDMLRMYLNPVENEAKEALEEVALDFKKFKLSEHIFDFMIAEMQYNPCVMFPFEWTSKNGTKYELNISIIYVDYEEEVVDVDKALFKHNRHGETLMYDFSMHAWKLCPKDDNNDMDFDSPEWDLEESALELGINLEEQEKLKKEAAPLMNLLGNMDDYMTAVFYLDYENSNIKGIHLVPYHENVSGFRILLDGNKYILEQNIENEYSQSVYSKPVFEVKRTEENTIELSTLFSIVAKMADRCYRRDTLLIPLSGYTYMQIKENEGISKAKMVSLSGRKTLSEEETKNWDAAKEVLGKIK
mgnify:CR=1 FL=1